MFRRKIFAPAAIMAWRTSADSVAGPKVQIILVLRMRGPNAAPTAKASQTGKMCGAASYCFCKTFSARFVSPVRRMSRPFFAFGLVAR